MSDVSTLIEFPKIYFWFYELDEEKKVIIGVNYILHLRHQMMLTKSASFIFGEVLFLFMDPMCWAIASLFI